MKDPFHNPTPWLKYSRLKPKTSRYYFSALKLDVKLSKYWEGIKHQFIPPLTKMKNKVIIVGDALCGSLAAAIAELNGLKIEIVRPEDMPAFEQPKPIEPIMIEPPYEFELFQPPITRRERRKQQRKSK